MSNNLNRKEMFFGSTEQVVCKNCGKEADVDTSKVLTSYPPQYEVKCPHCRKTDSVYCSALAELKISKKVPTATIKWEDLDLETALCIPCLVCGTPITTKTMQYEAAICEDCKKAILKLRKMLEDKDND